MKLPYSVFPSQPAIIPQSNGNWYLSADYIGPAINNSVTSISTGFITDGATIPRFAWRLLNHPMQLPLIAAAVLHDAEYSAELHTRKECDVRFLEAMHRLNISWLKRNTIHIAVRSFGWIVWNKHTALTIAAARLLVKNTPQPSS